MQEFSMHVLKGQGNGEMQMNALTALELLLPGLILLHLKMLQPQLQVSISFVYFMTLLIAINTS